MLHKLGRKHKIVLYIVLVAILFIGCTIYKTTTVRVQEASRVIKYRQGGVPWYSRNKTEFISDNLDENISQKTTKHIFWPNPPEWYVGSLTNKNIFLGCPATACKVHIYPNQTRSASEMDAVVFSTYSSDIQPFPRRSNQILCFFTLESPYHCQMRTWKDYGWKNQINLTITYRLDSDIIFIYGNVQKVQDAPNRIYLETIASKKSKLVAWVVSNCHTPSYRELYVYELAKHISVDIFGFCGSSREKDNLFEMIERDYKFHLSFENSLCVDYISEKFIRIQNRNIVAVVRGGGDYSKYYPSDTFINVDDFNSPKELARYLLSLDDNSKLYIDYLSKKSKFKFKVPLHPMCHLCMKLHDPNLKTSVYQDIFQWWMKETCFTPVDVDTSYSNVMWVYINTFFTYVTQYL